MTAPQSGVLRQVYKFKCRREQIREGWLGCPAFISVMESADLRKLHHLSEFRRLYLPRDRSILIERQVSARLLVVFEIRLQDATQAWFMQDDDVVQALAANRADQALDIGILPRRSRSREDFANAQPSCRFLELLSVARVAITKQIARRTVPRESFQQLPGRPFRRGIRGYREMNRTPAIM